MAGTARRGGPDRLLVAGQRPGPRPLGHHRDDGGDRRHRGCSALDRCGHPAGPPRADQAGLAQRPRSDRGRALGRRNRGLRDRRRDGRQRCCLACRHPRRGDGQGVRHRADRHVRPAERHRGRGAEPPRTTRLGPRQPQRRRPDRCRRSPDRVGEARRGPTSEGPSTRPGGRRSVPHPVHGSRARGVRRGGRGHRHR